MNFSRQIVSNQMEDFISMQQFIFSSLLSAIWWNKKKLMSMLEINGTAHLCKYTTYGKCSKILITFLFLFSKKKILVIRSVIHKMLVRIANREDPDQTASSEAV